MCLSQYELDSTTLHLHSRRYTANSNEEVELRRQSCHALGRSARCAVALATLPTSFAIDSHISTSTLPLTMVHH